MSRSSAGTGSVRSYSIGFGLSLILTFTAYITAAHQLAANWTLIYILLVLAVAQLFVQLVFFLHLGRNSRWNLTVLAFAVMVVLIIVIGSLWIMKHLNYSHDNLSPQQLNQSIVKDEGYGPSNK